jgi:hypothetical protein
MNYLIKNAHAILTGLAGEAARIQADSIRIGNGVITEIGSSLSLQAMKRNRCTRLRDLSCLGKYPSSFVSVTFER